jgi:hypothetical protein
MYVRGDFTMNYKFSDLEKYMNYLGFESGVVCFYPAILNPQFLSDDYGCKEAEFFASQGYEPSPSTHYDPRCRPWYKMQFED